MGWEADLGECKYTASGLPICIQNQKQRHIIRKFRQEHGRAFLGIINRYEKGPQHWMWEYMRGIVHNFECAFVSPRKDAKLEKLLEERYTAEYTGTLEDAKRLNTIFARMDKIGAVVLAWR